MVANHTQPVHLLLVEFLTATGVMLHDPVAEVAPHHRIKIGQRLIHAAHTADQCNQCGQFLHGLRAFIVIKLLVGMPDIQR